MGGTHYSVRSHGASLRLYSNRVFHSQWNPDRPFAGGVWDCLSLPVLHRPASLPCRAVVLGVGGGAVLRQFERLRDSAQPAIDAIGVEWDATHVDVATRWFGVPAERLVQADAVTWMRTHRDARFDVILDDLFGHADGEPVRAVPLEYDWVGTLAERLADDGLLIVNTATSRELKRAAPVFAEVGLRYGRRWTLPNYENAIGVLSRRPLHPRDWSRALDAAPLSAADRRQARTCEQQPLRGLDG